MAKKTPRPVVTEVTRRIDLEPADWFRAPWRKLKPLVPPEGRCPPFDRGRALAALRGLPPYDRWNMGEAGIATVPSPAEGRFWFTVLTTLKRMGLADQPVKLARRLARADLDEPLTVAEAKRHSRALDFGMPIPLWLRTLSACLSADEFLDVISDEKVILESLLWMRLPHLVNWLRTEAVPYCPPGRWEKVKARVRRELKQAWPWSPYSELRPALVYYLAAGLGLSRELEPVVRSWPDDAYRRPRHSPFNHEPQLIVLALGSAEVVSAEMRRLGLPLKYTWDARAWLAHTEYAGLDSLRDTILTSREVKASVERMLAVLCLVKAPEAAPHLLEIKLRSKVPKPAAAWLDEQVGNAVAGLVPVAAGEGDLADAAADYLRGAKQKGHGGLIEERLKTQTRAVAARVRRAVG
jgi:hypothetical protein